MAINLDQVGWALCNRRDLQLQGLAYDEGRDGILSQARAALNTSAGNRFSEDSELESETAWLLLSEAWL